MDNGTGAVEIPLTRGMVALVDVEDAELVNQFTWYAHPKGNGLWYARTGVHHQRFTMHWYIFGETFVDHINGNGLDNRLCNLRPATIAQNQWNQRKRQGTKTRFKGIHRHGPNWRAEIVVNGKRIRRSGYKSEVWAARGYDALARRYFGEYAALNFPRPGERGALV